MDPNKFTGKICEARKYSILYQSSLNNLEAYYFIHKAYYFAFVEI
jgi:hypothetical protein